MNYEPHLGPGVFGGHRGEYVRLVRDGSLRFITVEQVADIAALKRGEDPCQVVMPKDWAGDPGQVLIWAPSRAVHGPASSSTRT